MTKSKFAGLAQARLQDIEAEGVEPIEPIDETSAPTPKRQAKKKAAKREIKPDVPKSRKRDVRTSGKPEAKRNNRPVGTKSISINVPEEKRHWWNIQALLQGTTVTDAIIEAMDKRFGLPKKVRIK